MKGASMTAAAGQGGFRKEAVWIGLLLVGVILVYFYDIAFLGKTLRVSQTIPSAYPFGHFNYPGDPPKSIAVYDNTPGVLEEPYQEFKENSLRKGIFPLWNPHQAAGYPFLAALESSQLFLPEIVLYALPSPFRWDVYLLFRLFIAGLATYALLRVLGLSRMPAAVAGITYMFSGPVLSWVTNVTLNADILIPLLLLFTELTLLHDRKRYVVLNAIVVFQTIAAGHPEHTFFAFLTLGIYLCFRLWQKAYAYPLSRVIKNLSISFAAGLGMGAIPLIPFVEYLYFNAWHVHDPGVGLWASPFREAITMIFPWYYSSDLVSAGGVRHNTWTGGWLGLLPFWLALSAVFPRARRAASVAFIFIFLGYLSKIYGVPVINWIGYLPLFNFQRIYLHLTQAAAFAMAVLCGFAVSYLLEDERHILRLAPAAIPLVLLTLASLILNPPLNDPWRVFMLPAILFLAVLVGMLLALRGRVGRKALAWGMSFLLLAELFLLIPRERAIRAKAFQVPPYVRFLKRDPEPFRVYGIDSCLYPDTATAFGLDDIGMYEGLFVKRFATYIRELVDDRFFRQGSFHAFRSEVKDPASRFLDLLNLKYFILPRGARIPAERMKALSLKLVYDRDVQIFERLNVMPRVMIRHAADFVPDDEEALRLLRGGYDIGHRVLLDRAPVEGAAVGGPSVSTGSTVRVLDYAPNAKAFEVDMKTGGYLVVNDVHYPGWKATVDGEAREVLTANYLFQAVYVPAGRHRVAFEFAPLSVRAGLAISMLSLIALVLWALWGRRRSAGA